MSVNCRHREMARRSVTWVLAVRHNDARLTGWMQVNLSGILCRVVSTRGRVVVIDRVVVIEFKMG